VDDPVRPDTANHLAHRVTAPYVELHATRHDLRVIRRHDLVVGRAQEFTAEQTSGSGDEQPHPTSL
jgi:hypothetical protein